MTSSQTTYVQTCLDRLRAGDDAAREDLLHCISDRFRQLCHQMLGEYARLRRWEETDDVFTAALFRLDKALRADSPESPRHFFRLAALQVRRELRDLSRHYFGPDGMGANHGTAAADEIDHANRPIDPLAKGSLPHRLHVWTELHAEVERLADDLRETFELIWYHQLSQTEAAALLEVSRRTVIRRWQAACLQLHDALGNDLLE